MAKVLKDTELLDIIRQTIEERRIKDTAQYLLFLTNLAEVVTEQFGGTVGIARDDTDLELGFTVSIHHNTYVPEDGGVYKSYDEDVDWSEGGERE